MNMEKKIQLLNSLLLIPASQWEWKETITMRKLAAFGATDEQINKHRICSVYVNDLDVVSKNINFMETIKDGTKIRLILHGGLHIFQIGGLEIANWNNENNFILSFSHRIVLRITKYYHEQKKSEKEKQA